MGENKVAKKKEMSVMSAIQYRIDEKMKNDKIVIPNNYNVKNAIISAELKLKAPGFRGAASVMDSCTPESIQESVFDMVIQGLSPSKNQCYFVGYKGHCKLMRSYMGTIAVAKRFTEVKDVRAFTIFKGDDFATKFDIEHGILKIVTFDPKFDNIDVAEVVGSFCMVFGDDGLLQTEIMTMAQLTQAWQQGFAYKSEGGTHQKFTEEMAKKTVTARALKLFVNTSDDVDDTIAKAYNNENEDIQEAEIVEPKREEIDFNPEEVKQIEEKAEEVKNVEIIEKVKEAIKPTEKVVVSKKEAATPTQEKIEVGF